MCMLTFIHLQQISNVNIIDTNIQTYIIIILFSNNIDQKIAIIEQHILDDKYKIFGIYYTKTLCFIVLALAVFGCIKKLKVNIITYEYYYYM